MTARIISFINYKGGVGKTTTTYHIGCALAYVHGKRVLLVDIDPQCNLTFLCVTHDRWKKYVNGGGSTVVSLYENYLSGKGFTPQSAVWKSPIEDRKSKNKPLLPSLDLLPSNISLLIDPDVRVARSRLSKTNPLAAQVSAIQIKAETYVLPRIFLSHLLASLRDQYDHILIDCPPNLYLLTQNALLASEHYVITALPDHLSTIGIELLMTGAADIAKTVDGYARLIGAKVSIPVAGGIVFVRVLRQTPTRVHAETINRLTAQYPRLVFNNPTTELTGYQEAAAEAMPVFLHGSGNAKRAANQYFAITQEFIQRFP